MLVHYGPVDLEAEGPLPVRFVLGRQSLDVNALAAACSTIFGGGGRVLVVPSLPYVHAAFDLAAALATACPSAIVCGADIERDAEPTGPPPPPAASSSSSSDGANDDALGVSSDLSRGRLLGRTLPVPLSEEALQSSELSLLYVGTEEEQTLSNLCMLLPNAAVHLCTPPSGSSGSGDGVGDSRGGSAGGSGGVWDRYAADTANGCTNGHDSGDTDQQLAITRLSLPTAKRLMRRYYLVHKAREAEIVGILVGTLSASKRKDMLTSLKKLVKSSGRKVRAASQHARKHTALPSHHSSTPRSSTTHHAPPPNPSFPKSYTFVMGKLNAAKLANFIEVGVYVLLGSCEHSILDAKDFYRPVVTPYELHLALTPGAEWTGEYILDYGRLLPRLLENEDDDDEEEVKKPDNAAVDAAEDDDEEDEVLPEFSLLSGRLISRQRNGMDHTTTTSAATTVDTNGNGASGSSSALVESSSSSDGTLARRGEYAIARTGAEALARREYRGLDPRLGEHAPARVVEGLAGIASGFLGEGERHLGGPYGKPAVGLLEGGGASSGSGEGQVAKEPPPVS